MPRATKKVVGFVVGQPEDGIGKFVKTAEEASQWLAKQGAEVDAYGVLEDGFQVYVVTDKGDMRCADTAPAGVKVSVPSGYYMAE